MKAIICDDYGSLENLTYKESEPPKINDPDDVIIKVESCGVNFPDGLLVQGKYQHKPETPFIPGMEVSGKICSIGLNVKEFDVGDRVAGLTQLGGYAEITKVNKQSIYKMPNSMSHDEACAMLCAYGTSHYALKQRAKIKNGETLVVLGASGSTGIAAIQIGKIYGAKVIAASSSKEKQDFAKKLGADISIGYENLKDDLKRITNGNGVDIIFDPVGGSLFETSSRALARYGRILVIGFASGEIPKFPVNLALVKEFDVVGVFWGTFTRNNKKDFQENMKELFQWYEKGLIIPKIEEKFSLQNAAKALSKILNRGTKGKVILNP